ncbi:MAG: hypothetical protein LLF28_03150 [Nitrospiraceae bacterium]|nr:hypothetical protein [Nitrospiraceae bacterium]
MAAKKVSLHMPQDSELLAALGEVAIRHEQLSYILKMTIKSLTGVTPEEALKATTHEGSAQLRDRVKKNARKRLGEGAPLVKLQAILVDCKRLTDKRNDLIHGMWAKGLDGYAHIRDSCGNVRPIPPSKDLLKLASELEKLTRRLNTERLEGFLFQALSKRKP